MQSLLQKLLLGNAGGGGGGNPSLNLNFVDGSAFDPRITFSRTSNATLTDSTGLVAYAPHNLLTYSEQFDNAAWSKVNATVTADASVAPDGTTTADKLIANTTLDQHRCDQTPSSTAVAQTFSVYAKAAGYGFVGLRLNVTGALFDLSTGATSNVSAGITAQSTSVGNGWYRCSITKATGVANDVCRINISDGSAIAPNFTGNGTDGILIWGAQLNVNPMAGGVTSSLSTYYPTTATAYYGPRFDYDPVTLAAKGLLIEEQRTNLLTYSEQFDNAAWVKTSDGGITVSANTIVAPDGTLTADKFIPNAVAGFHAAQQTYVFPNAAHSFSFYAKADQYSAVQIFDGLTTDFVNFNLLTVQVGSSLGYTGTITPAGNGWYRCTGTKTFAAGSTAIRIGVVTSSTAVRGESFTGDGTSGLFVWGAQLEAGAFPTSYIPTVASQVTRNADVAAINTLSPWFNATEGTIYAECSTSKPTSVVAAANAALFSDGTSNNRTGLRYLTGNVEELAIVGGATQAQIQQAYTASSIDKLAGAIKANDFAFARNGALVGSDTVGTVPTVDRLGVGVDHAGLSPLNGHIRRITYYPTRLTNAALQQITT